mgnify:CR=1 FL=1
MSSAPLSTLKGFGYVLVHGGRCGMAAESRAGHKQVRRRFARRAEAFLGIMAVLALAVFAQWLGGYLPLLGASVTGLVLGVLLRLTLGLPGRWVPGVRLASNQLLKLAIVCLGAGMSLGQIWKTGSQAILIILASVVLGIAVCAHLGRRLGVSYELSQLIGVGTSICGATAIAATAPIIRANEMDTAYAVSTLFTFNLLAVFVYPLTGHLLGLDDVSFGMWAGTAIHDTSSVVAAGYAYSDRAGDVATVIKLTRTLFLLPVVLTIGIACSLRSNGKKVTDLRMVQKAFPLFLLGFLAFALIRTSAVLPASLLDAFYGMGKFLAVVALVAIGLSSDLREMRRSGFKPLFLGLAAAAAVGVVSLVLIQVLHPR